MILINPKPEYIGSIYNFEISNTLFTSIIVTIILLIFSLYFYFKVKSAPNNFIVLGIKILIKEILKITDYVTESRALSKKILPVILTFFIYITTANLIELVPGFLGSFYIEKGGEEIAILRSPNSDLNITLSLAIFSVLAIQFFAIKKLGLKKYLLKFFNIKTFSNFVLGIFEFLSEFTKILSFSFRLFGNLFAGEVLLLIIAFIFPYLIPIPFMILEVFVGIVQAFIFSILTLTFIKTSSTL